MGEVEALGKNVTRFKKGDRVNASTGARFGAYAEDVCLPSTAAIPEVPVNMTYEEAAVVPLGGLNALHYLRKGNIEAGQQVLINGAGGSFGTFAVQLAKHFGAEVTAVDSSEKLDMLRDIGADHVIDYTKQDYTDRGETYDIVLNMVVKSSFSSGLRSVKKNGCYILATPNGISQMIRALWASAVGSKKVTFEFANETTEDLLFLEDLIEQGKIRSVVDRCYPLEQAADAHRYVESGQKIGNVVLTVGA